MPDPAELIPTLKAALLDVWAPADTPIEGLAAVADHEPTQAPDMPLLSMMTRGFRRARLETPDLEGEGRIQDPISGRRWVFLFWIRVWVALGSDAEAAQKRLDVLIPRVVVALENDRSLGGVAVDAAMSSGDAGIVSPQQGQPTLMLTCDLAIETEEPLT